MISRTLPLIGILVAGIAVCAGYGVWYAALAAKSAAVANLQNQIAVRTQTAGRVASARAALVELESDEAMLKGYFLPETDVVAFIDRIEALGEAQRAAVNVLSVAKGTSKTQPSLVFSLSVEGAFDAVMRTVGIIEYLPYDLSISGLSLSLKDKGVWHADLIVSASSVPQTKNAL